MADAVFSGGNVPTSIAAKIMKKDPMFVRIGLQTGKLPFGVALKKDELLQQHDYYISPKLFYEFTGFLYKGDSDGDR